MDSTGAASGASAGGDWQVLGCGAENFVIAQTSPHKEGTVLTIVEQTVTTIPLVE